MVVLSKSKWARWQFFFFLRLSTIFDQITLQSRSLRCLSARSIYWGAPSVTNAKLKDSQHTGSCQAGGAGDGFSHRRPLNCLKLCAFHYTFFLFQTPRYFGWCLTYVLPSEVVMWWNKGCPQGVFCPCFTSKPDDLEADFKKWISLFFPRSIPTWFAMNRIL